MKYSLASTHNILIAFGIYFCSSTLAAESINESEKLAQSYQCSVELKTPVKSKNSAIKSNPVKDAIYLEADKGNIQPESTSTLDGNVIIQQNTTVFTADSAELNRRTDQLIAKGNVVLSDRDFSLESPSINYNLKNKTGTIDDAKYAIGSVGAHGKSSKIQQLDKNRLQMEEATFTSCPISKDSWHLASGEINLNKETQIGTAKNVTFNVGKVPVFYFPWLSFPINNQRLSGFLSPSIKLQTNDGITIPYYFNLAPNYDATVDLTTIESRGIQINSEFRYLSKKHKGELRYSFLPGDNSFNEQNRDYFSIEHKTKLNSTTHININAEGVSDKDYFDDFSTSLESSTRSALQRRIEITRSEGPWRASAALEDFQILGVDDPYSKLPELTLNYTPKTGPKDFTFGIDSEFVYFDKDSNSSINEPTGARADIKVKLSRKWGNDAWYFKPSLSLQHTLYALQDPIGKSSINRTLPTLSLDGGLFYDREFTSKSGKSLIQTLEPRLFFTHTPFEDQNDIPLFDTAKINTSESNQLFLENRFTGKDRIADTKQLTFAVSSRIQDRDNGKELFKATIGQVINFSDRKVTLLPGGTILTGKRSDLLLELTGRINDNFRLSSTINLKSDNKSISSYDLRLNYQDKKRRIANLSFRKIDTELEQVSISTSLPINDKWSMVASSDHDTKNNRNLESLLGLEYQDCCWKTRMVVKRFLTSDNETYETPVFIEFELKGLGKIGRSASSQIKEKIYGYDDF